MKRRHFLRTIIGAVISPTIIVKAASVPIKPIKYAPQVWAIKNRPIRGSSLKNMNMYQPLSENFIKEFAEKVDKSIFNKHYNLGA